MEEEDTIDLRAVWKIIKKRLKLIILITFVCVAATAIVSYLVISPVYEASTSIIIGKAPDQPSTNNQSGSNANDITMYQNLLKTYASIAKSDLVSDKTAGLLNNGMTGLAVQSSTTVTPETDTQILDIKSQSTNPVLAQTISNTLTSTFIEESQKIYPTDNIKVMDSAKLPISAVSPKKALNIAIAFLIGLMSSIGLAFILELMDNSIKTEEDVNKLLELPVLGSIPKDMEKSNLVTVKNPRALTSEAYKTLRTNIRFSAFDKKVKVILVTSAGPGEGKSITSANLAVVMAQSGSKTLLIDCDQRKPTIHRLFELSNTHGLSNLLVGEESSESAIVDSGIENLQVLTSGIKPPNPAELMGSNAMSKFIDVLRDKYDYIILDTPPILLVTDAQVISKYSDGCLLVVASNESEKEAVIKSKEALKKVDSKLLGVVLNKVKESSRSYYKQYYDHDHEDKKQKNKKSRKNKFGKDPLSI